MDTSACIVYASSSSSSFDFFGLTKYVQHLDRDAAEAGRTDPASHSPALANAWKLSNTLTDELVGASHIVIATPMYNWGMPSALKAWVDRVINFRTFYARTDSLSGIPITVIAVSGGPYSPDAGVPQLMKDDFLRPHLQFCLTKIGSDPKDIMFLNGDPTGRLDMDKDADPSDASKPFGRAVAKMPKAVARLAETDVL